MKLSIQSIRNKPIVLGLQLADQDSGLLQTAISLARQLSSRLELVHAVPPIFNYIGVGDLVVNPYHGYDAALGDSEVASARQSLEKVKATLAKDLEVGLHIVRDNAPDALRTIAQEVQAGLIICGIQEGAAKKYLLGASTAFALAGDADCPVLIVPAATKISFTHQTQLLVADKLDPVGLTALETAICLSNDLGSSEICHAHVHSIRQGDADHMAEVILEAMTLGRIPNNPEFSAKSYLAELHEKLRDDLSSRFNACQGRERTRSRYTTEVAFGRAAEELHKIAAKHDSKVMVFGRHHLLNRKAFALGKVPYSAMIESGLATLIVPDGA